MEREVQTEDSDNLELASGAVRSEYFDGFSLGLLALFLILIDLNHDWLVFVAAVLAWLVINWLFDRWRLGPDHRTIRKAERDFMRGFGLVPYFLGFGIVISSSLFLGVQDVIGSSGLGIAAVATGWLCQALWVSYKLKDRASADLAR